MAIGKQIKKYRTLRGWTLEELSTATASEVDVGTISALTTPVPEEVLPAPIAAPDPNAPTIDPTNARIVTTAGERRVLAVCQEVLSGEDLQSKDTESYYTVLYQGKSNRWLLRYWADKKRPSIAFCMPLTDAHKAEIKRAKLELASGDSIMLDRPDQLLRLPGLLDDALAFCKKDENFKRSGASS